MSSVPSDCPARARMQTIAQKDKQASRDKFVRLSSGREYAQNRKMTANSSRDVQAISRLVSEAVAQTAESCNSYSARQSSLQQWRYAAGLVPSPGPDGPFPGFRVTLGLVHRLKNVRFVMEHRRFLSRH